MTPIIPLAQAAETTITTTTTTPTPINSETLAHLALIWGAKIAGVIVVLVVAWALGFYARRAIGRVMDKTRLDKTLGRFLGNIIRWVIFVMAIVACLGFFGFNITSVAALVGAAGLTIGLAMQGSLSNLAAGIMLMFLRPFRIGDTVVIAGQTGKVDDLDLFNTKIDTGDNRRLIIPNGAVFAATIENTTHHPVRMVDVPVTVAGGADLAATREALRRAGESVAKRDPSRAVGVAPTGFVPGGVSWVVQVWAATADVGGAKDALIVAIKTELDAAGLAGPAPTLDLFFRNPLETNAAAARNGNGHPAQPVLS